MGGRASQDSDKLWIDRVPAFPFREDDPAGAGSGGCIVCSNGTQWGRSGDDLFTEEFRAPCCIDGEPAALYQPD